MPEFIESVKISELREFFNFMTGKEIGRGASRVVFNHPQDPTLVIKAEFFNDMFQNQMEWRIWEDFKNVPRVAAWLAPCHEISACGTFLIQTKAVDMQPHQIPKNIPEWLDDVKTGNLGVIGNKIVVRDYGFINLTMKTGVKKWPKK